MRSLASRVWIGGAFAALLVLAVLRREAAGAAPSGDTPWRIAVLPDTQKYTVGAFGAGQPGLLPDHYGLHFQSQADTIAAVHDLVEIVFVLHEGDVVESQLFYDAALNPDPASAEWQFARAEMDKLNGLVDWCAAAGNHDLSYPGQPSDLTPDATEYVNHFGPSAYAGQATYLSSSASGTSHAHLFAGGPYRFLSLVLPFEADDAEVAWAQSMLDANPCVPAILTTHAYLWNVPGAEGHSTQRITPGGNTGAELWEELVRPNEQIFLVLGGHFHAGATLLDKGEYHQVSTNDAGLPVIEMLANYQDFPQGGLGFLRLLSFEPGAGSPDRLSVLTYSTTHPSYWTLMNDADSLFSFDLDFAARFSPCAGR